MIDFQKLAHFKGVAYDPPNNRGWIHFHCPFCRDTGRHLGNHLSTWKCYKCGRKKEEDVLRRVFGVTKEQASRFIYDGFFKSIVKKVRAESFKMPVPLSGSLHAMARRYLSDRKFDFEQIIKDYDIATPEDNMSAGRWACRIIAPVIMNGLTVTCFGRDYSGRSEIRYLFPEGKKSKNISKEVFYNLDRVDSNYPVALVEGPTDVWRLGPQSICGFGTGISNAQIKLLNEKKVKHLCLIPDNDEPGMKSANEVASTVASLTRIKTTIVTIDSGDPAELSEKEAGELMAYVRERS